MPRSFDVKLWRAAGEVLERLMQCPCAEREAMLAAMTLEQPVRRRAARLLRAMRDEGLLDRAGPGWLAGGPDR